MLGQHQRLPVLLLRNGEHRHGDVIVAPSSGEIPDLPCMRFPNMLMVEVLLLLLLLPWRAVFTVGISAPRTSRGRPAALCGAREDTKAGGSKAGTA